MVPGRVQETVMLKWAAIFFVISLVAAVFGFTGIAVGFAAMAKALFYIALTIFVICLILGFTVYRKMTD